MLVRDGDNAGRPRGLRTALGGGLAGRGGGGAQMLYMTWVRLPPLRPGCAPRRHQEQSLLNDPVVP